MVMNIVCYRLHVLMRHNESTCFKPSDVLVVQPFLNKIMMCFIKLEQNMEVVQISCEIASLLCFANIEVVSS